MELTFSVLVNVNYFILKLNCSYHPAVGCVVSNRRLSCLYLFYFIDLFRPNKGNLSMAQMVSKILAVVGWVF